MSKDYLCKDCISNNNGWCKKRKFNGLTKITECSDKQTEGYLSNEGQNQYNKNVDDLYKDIDYTPYKNMGKREMFHIIQTQLYAMNNNETVKTVKQVMVNLEKMLSINEQLQGIKSEYEIDKDIITSSKNISKIWENEVGGYKGE